MLLVLEKLVRSAVLAIAPQNCAKLSASGLGDVVAWGRQPCRVRRYKALRTPWALVQVYPQLEEKFFGGFEWNQSLLSRSASAPTQTLYLEDQNAP